MKWQPNQYNAFEGERFLPINDLLSKLPKYGFKTIYDLGCGTGAAFRPLQQKYPNAKIIGIDSDASMLQKAKEANPNTSFLHSDILTWLDSNINGLNNDTLIFSNAALHWLDDHQILLPSIFGLLGDGGCLAVQMPNNWDEPSHKEMLTQAKSPPWAQTLKPLLRERPVLSKVEYANILAPLCQNVLVWNKTYNHKLSGDRPVVNWLKGSTLQYYLDALPPEQQQNFTEDLNNKLKGAYAADKNGVVEFPFNRLFIIARN